MRTRCRISTLTASRVHRMSGLSWRMLCSIQNGSTLSAACMHPALIDAYCSTVEPRALFLERNKSHLQIWFSHFFPFFDLVETPGCVGWFCKPQSSGTVSTVGLSCTICIVFHLHSSGSISWLFSPELVSFSATLEEWRLTIGQSSACAIRRVKSFHFDSTYMPYMNGVRPLRNALTFLAQIILIWSVDPGRNFQETREKCHAQKRWEFAEI